MFSEAVRLHPGKLTAKSCVRILKSKPKFHVYVPFLGRLFMLGVGLEVYFHVRALKTYPSKFKDACQSCLLVSKLSPDRVVTLVDILFQRFLHTLV